MNPLSNSRRDEMEKELENLREQYKLLRIEAQPINTKIYLIECEIYALEDDIEKML